MQQKADATTKTAERELVLHYIDKLHATYVQTGQTRNRMTVLLVVVSLLVFGLSLGTVSVDQSLSLGGLRVAINSALLLIGGSVLIGMLLVYVFSLSAAGMRLRDKILLLYMSVGMKEDVFLKTVAGTFIVGFEGVLEVLTSGVFRPDGIGDVALTIITGIFVTIIGLFPVIAQIAACWRMILLFGWTWWVIVSFALILSITISFLIFYTTRITAAGPSQTLE